jgi:hypothetical protein
MSNSDLRAQPALPFLPPQYNRWVCQGAQLTLLPLLRWRTSVAHIKVENGEQLLQTYQDFADGKIRWLLAFRHPSVDDPLVLSYCLWHWLPRYAKRQGVTLPKPVHTHFIYDRGIPLWAGRWVSWLYPKLGGTPIHRGKVDRVGLRSARDLFLNGQFPMMAAPEGATNGHNEIISPLEPGVAQLGFWCVEDLQKANRGERVLILPVGIQYDYLQPPWQGIEKLLGKLEQDMGVPQAPDRDTLPETPVDLGSDRQMYLYRRLLRLGDRLLSVMAEFYRYHYQQPIPEFSSETDLNVKFQKQLPVLLDAALRVSETYFGLSGKGTFVDRCRRIEQAGWEFIYRSDIQDWESLSLLERGLADWIAVEANRYMWHMRLVESFVAVTGDYVKENPTAERFADTLFLMWDVMARFRGSNPFKRPRLGQQRATIRVGTPIDVSHRFERYQTSRRQAVSELTQQLQLALTSLIR